MTAIAHLGRTTIICSAIGLGLLVSGCSIGPSTGSLPEQVAQAPLRATQVDQPLAAKPVEGMIRFAAMKDGATRITGEVKNLKPNAVHGFHIHERGDCSAPDAMSAGGHFNPTGSPHGAPGHGHVGDLPTLQADAMGTARVQYVSQSVKLTGPNSVVGKGVIVHKDPDDINAQPAGNSGPRLACGVIAGS
ncbi:superoxide dismutase family protein [Ottowia thiooxydans]|uniref:superoxide dismutase family protein n=1 Tax=Ottowia thiooxydans TaxID=219182 RepID=UPI0003FCE467|nr:superoxide dismutase family protein [Ottowia thiooxydans]